MMCCTCFELWLCFLYKMSVKKYDNLSDAQKDFKIFPTAPAGCMKARKFGKLTVLNFAGSIKGIDHWICACSCGRFTRVRRKSLNVNRGVKSCGCLTRNAHQTHGETSFGKISAEYSAYCAAKYRCGSPKCPNYANYGGRGITFDFRSFKDFIAHVGRRPIKKGVHFSLDRIDNNRGYCPGNVRWATAETQTRNRRVGVVVEIGGVSQSVYQHVPKWNTKSKSYRLAIIRIRNGYSPLAAIFGPKGTPTRKARKCAHDFVKGKSLQQLLKGLPCPSTWT